MRQYEGLASGYVETAADAADVAENLHRRCGPAVKAQARGSPGHCGAAPFAWAAIVFTSQRISFLTCSCFDDGAGVLHRRHIRSRATVRTRRHRLHLRPRRRLTRPPSSFRMRRNEPFRRRHRQAAATASTNPPIHGTSQGTDIQSGKSVSPANAGTPHLRGPHLHVPGRRRAIFRRRPHPEGWGCQPAQRITLPTCYSCGSPGLSLDWKSGKSGKYAGGTSTS